MPDGDLELPTGRIMQRPPAYSAVKVGGRRAYALARAGAEVELPEREVEVYGFDERWRDGDRRAFVIECSSGTYVRSLIADLGDAYCEQLRRTRIGAFDVADADPERLLALVDALAFLPAVELDDAQAGRDRAWPPDRCHRRSAARHGAADRRRRAGRARASPGRGRRSCGRSSACDSS